MPGYNRSEGMASDAGGRYALLFDSLAPLANAGTQPPFAACLLSMRDQERVPHSIAIRERPVAASEQIERPAWPSERAYLNYDARLSWLTESPALARDLLFIPLAPQLQYCLFVHGPLPVSIVGAAGRYRVTVVRLPRIRREHLMLVSSSPHDLIGVFASLSALQTLYDSACIGVDAAKDAMRWTTDDQLFLARLLDDPYPEAVLRQWGDRPPGWAYCALVSPVTYDVGDPVYCSATEHHATLVEWLHALCKRHGYRVYDLPLAEEVILTWLLRGEIPLLCPGLTTGG